MSFIYLRVGAELLASVDRNLSAQTEEVGRNAEAARALVDSDATDGPTVAEILTAHGLVRAHPSTLPALPLQPVGDRRFTARVAGLREEWRFLEVPERIGGKQRVVVVGRSLAAREETLHRLAREFLAAAPVALLLAVLAGYALAAAALRPVEAMRRRAAAVTAEEPGRRLPVPAARDEIRLLALTLNEMLARLEASFEHERRFLSDASHSFVHRSRCFGGARLALRRPRTRDELEATVRSASEETERLCALPRTSC